MKKRRSSLIIVLAILLVVFNVVVFALQTPKTATFWLADVFAFIAIAGQAATHYMAYGKADSLMSKVYGYPVVQVGYIYLIVQLIVSLVFIIVSAWIPWWITTMIGVILLGLAATGVIANDNTRDTIEDIDVNNELQTQFMKRLYARASSVAGYAKDKELHKQLEAFAQEVYYSDTVSGPELNAIENDMWEVLRETEIYVKNDDVLAATELTVKLNEMLKERNNLCHLYKKRNVNRGTVPME